MRDKIYPCDISGFCPFEAKYGATCRNCCGMGVDEDSIPEEEPYEPEIDEPEIDESMNPYDGTYDWENDVSMIGDD